MCEMPYIILYCSRFREERRGITRLTTAFAVKAKLDGSDYEIEVENLVCHIQRLRQESNKSKEN